MLLRARGCQKLGGCGHVWKRVDRAGHVREVASTTPMSRGAGSMDAKRVTGGRVRSFQSLIMDMDGGGRGKAQTWHAATATLPPLMSN